VKGVLMLMGKPPKGAPSNGGRPPAEPKGDAEREYAREAFGALKEDDEAGFVEAFLGAVKACVSKSKGGGYDDEEA
jgi:hypothetical protein